MRGLLLTLTTCLLALSVQAKYSGGSGEPNDPYQIATAADLMALGNEPNDYDKHFILTADIDLDPNLPGRKVFDKAVIARDSDDAPLGIDATVFARISIFDGDGLTISHLAVKGTNYMGLFAQLAPGAGVNDLGVFPESLGASSGLRGREVGPEKLTIVSEASPDYEAKNVGQAWAREIRRKAPAPCASIDPFVPLCCLIGHVLCIDAGIPFCKRIRRLLIFLPSKRVIASRKCPCIVSQALSETPCQSSVSRTEPCGGSFAYLAQDGHQARALPPHHFHARIVKEVHP